MHRDEALAYLLGRIDYERTLTVPYHSRQFKLEPMRRLLAELGDPQKAYVIVHIAGTKGKGSTAATIAAMLTASGQQTGLYTSPHLEFLEERFRVDGIPCNGEELARLVEALAPAVAEVDAWAAASGEAGPSYFDITTAAAMLHFARRKVDVAVLEVGLGGRFDSTNVCEPAVTAITSISYDHTAILGDTLAQIAREKGGIIKPGIPLVCGPLLEEPAAVIRDIAHERGSALFAAGSAFDVRYRPAAGVAPAQFDYLPHAVELTEAAPYAANLTALPLRLAGQHQAENAGVAITARLLLAQRNARFACDADSIRRGLANVECAARIEFFGSPPQVVLDTAHNVASAAALCAALEQLERIHPVSRRTLLFATASDKDLTGILACLVPRFDRVICTEFQGNRRATPAADVAAAARTIVAQSGAKLDIVICDDPIAAWNAACDNLGPSERICIAGSFFLAGELRPLVREAKFACGKEIPF